MKNRKSILLLLALVISAFILYTYGYTKKRASSGIPLANECLIITTQQATTGTDVEFRNKISFQAEVANYCEERKEFKGFKIITKKSFSDKTKIMEDRVIDFPTQVEARSTINFDHVLELDEAEFNQHYNYWLELVK